LKINEIENRLKESNLIRERLEEKKGVVDNFGKDLEKWGLGAEDILKTIESRLAEDHSRVGGINFKETVEKGLLLKEIALENNKIEMVGGIVGKLDELKEKGLELASKSANLINIRINAGEKDLSKHLPLVINVFEVFGDIESANKYQKIYEAKEQLSE
jgi:hypothetical protein